MRTLLLLLLTLHLPAAGPAVRAGTPGGLPLDSLAIEVRGASREYAFTNKTTAFLYGETSAPNRPGWQGFHAGGAKVMDDYALAVNGTPLDRHSALRTLVYPDRLVREYPGGVSEEVRPVDSLALFAVVVRTPRPAEVIFTPLPGGGRTAADFVVEEAAGTVQIARRAQLSQSPPPRHPLWLTLHSPSCTPLRGAAAQNGPPAPASLVSRRQRETRILVAATGGREEGSRIVAMVERDPLRFFRARRERMQQLLDATALRTSDQRFDRALAWAKLSLDALVMDQVTYGIFAGLPWFANYWGRDSFIALPGATLVTGRFDEAKRIIRSFAAFQQRDTASPDMGRIPNLVTAAEKSYNTADGTPRMVAAMREYVLRSGDTAFVDEVYPAVLRSIEGALRHRVDSLGFLTHADAETWMDAVGPGGAWSPRGNRANDIQALWAGQLETGVWFATLLGDVESARMWDAALKRLRRNFPGHFLHTGGVADHLNRDGTRDRQVRPNQIFAFPLLDSASRESALAQVVGELTYAHGVASLAQDDPAFHPWHEVPAYYPKDAAYHNGTVWTWLQGPVITELCRRGWQDLAWRVTGNSVGQILDRGAVGTQSELLDALPRPGETEPRVSGTFSQAWNLAEFVRNTYDDYLGIRVDRFNHRMTIRPRLPAGMRFATGRIDLGGRGLPFAIERTPGGWLVRFDAGGLRFGGACTVSLPAGEHGELSGTFRVIPGKEHVLQVEGNAVKLFIDKRLELFAEVEYRPDSFRPCPYALLVPRSPAGLPTLRGPAHEVLSGKQIKRSNPAARVLFRAEDPPGDDRGVAGATGYTYPSHPAMLEGCLDLLGFELSEDDSLAYFKLRFRTLADPGWHPEYGFQLTVAAIAIHRGPGGVREVPHNAAMELPAERSYERLVLVGGGVRLEEAGGRILAEYIPAGEDAADPLGNAARGEIRFSLPKRLLGDPSPSWKLTVLAGAQDDHGGAGIGEFRTVAAEREEWVGGGKESAGLPNVYDEMVVPR